MSYRGPPQTGYPGQPQQGYPGAQPQQGYPGAQPQQGHPGAQPQQGYPGAQPQQGHPGAQPQHGYPGAQPQQGYPGAQPQQGYSGAQPQQGYPAAQQSMDPNIMSWFAAVDQDKSGQINSNELKAALQNGNSQTFSDEACNLMISMFDTDRSGTINLQEFAKLFNYINLWTSTYRRLDRDNSGSIDEREMTVSMTEMGYRLSPQFISFLVSKFASKNRQIVLDKFIICNVQIHRLSEMFKMKDVNRTGSVTLSYEDFMTMALTV